MALEIEEQGSGGGKDSLGDALGTILDKGLVIAGDISIHLVKTELLTIKIRLILASVDRAEAMGIDWWKRDAFLSNDAQADAPLLNVEETIAEGFDRLAQEAEPREAAE